jgi:hypothetical protein
MTLTHVIVVVSLLLPAASLDVTLGAEAHMCDSQAVKVLGRGETPQWISGIVATFVEIRVRCKCRTETAYIPYMEVSQRFPNDGDECRIRYEMGEVNGVVGLVGVRLGRAKIVSSIACVSTKP